MSKFSPKYVHTYVCSSNMLVTFIDCSLFYVYSNFMFIVIIYNPILRFSPFVKVGAESYVLGHAIKKAPRIADAEKIRIIVSSGIMCGWGLPCRYVDICII